MLKKPKEPFEDDGRTIADMSGVENHHSSLLGRLPRRSREKSDETPKTPVEPLSKRQGRMAIGGALLAALLVGGVFIVAGAIAILVMILLWT